MMPLLGPPKKGGDSAESDLAHGVSAACLPGISISNCFAKRTCHISAGGHSHIRSEPHAGGGRWLAGDEAEKLATGWRGRGRRFRAAARSQTSVSTPSPIGCATYTARGQRRTGQLQLPMAGNWNWNWRACVLAWSEEGGKEREEEKKTRGEVGGHRSAKTRTHNVMNVEDHAARHPTTLKCRARV